MKNKILILFLFFPFLLFGQIFNDIKKEDDRKNVDHRSKGLIIGINGNFGILGSLNKIQYNQTYLTGSQKTYTRETLPNNFHALFYEAFAIYRYKKIGAGLGVNRLHFECDNDAYGEESIKNTVSINSIVSKFFFRERIVNSSAIELILNVGIPFFSSSSLSSDLSSNFMYGLEFNYSASVFKNLDLKLGLSYTRFDMTYNEFNYKRANGPGATSGSMVSYDFTMNKGKSDYFGIMGVQLGLQYNINQLIK